MELTTPLILLDYVSCQGIKKGGIFEKYAYKPLARKGIRQPLFDVNRNKQIMDIWNKRKQQETKIPIEPRVLNKTQRIYTLDAINISSSEAPFFKAALERGKQPNVKLPMLLKHKRHHNIVFHVDEKCFRVNMTGRGNGRRYTGAMNVLKAIFWPDFSVTDACKKAQKSAWVKHENKKRRQKAAEEKWESRKSVLETSKRPRGMDLGSVVHEEIEDYINMKAVDFRKKHPEINAYTAKVLIKLREQHLRPVSAELPIFDEKLRTATAIDMVCLNTKNGHPVLVELKTGYEGYFRLEYGKPLKRPLENFDCMPLNQARLQILFSRLIIKYRYQIGNICSIVMHVHRTGVDIYSVPRPWLRFEDRIYEQILTDRLGSNKTFNKKRGASAQTQKTKVVRKRARNTKRTRKKR